MQKMNEKNNHNCFNFDKSKHLFKLVFNLMLMSKYCFLIINNKMKNLLIIIALLVFMLTSCGLEKKMICV